MNNEYINNLSKEIHSHNVSVGWWKGNQCIFEKLQLVSTEVAEATEGERKNLMDDHLPHRKMAEVELADCMIRVLDIGGRLNLIYTETQGEVNWCHKTSSIGKQHLGLNKVLIYFAVTGDIDINDVGYKGLSCSYSILIDAIIQVSDNQGYDLWGAIKEKREYNSQRADHKPENRAKQNGKKF